MNRSQRAAQLWPILALAASNRQILDYKIVSQLTGMYVPGIGQMLEPIQSYCLLHNLPPLTILVVQKESGLPGSGFTAAEAVEFTHAMMKVFSTDWLTVGCPTPEQFEEAVRTRPSNGS